MEVDLYIYICLSRHHFSIWLPGLYMPRCVKGEDSSSHRALTAAPKTVQPYPSGCSSIYTYSAPCSHVQPVSSEVCTEKSWPTKKTLSSCGRPSTATGFHNSSSDKVTRVQVAEMHCLVSVIITSIEDDGSATRPESHDAPRSHDAVTVSKCQRQKMTVCHEKQQVWGGIRLQAGRSWLRSRGVKAADGKPECADTLAVHYASPKFSLHAAENKVWLIKADGSVEKRAIMRKSSALCRWQWCKQKALLSSPAGGFFFFSVEPLW